MKITRALSTVLAALFVASLVSAAETKAVPLVLSVAEIHTDDVSGYAAWIARNNAAAKAKLGIDPYMRLFQAQVDGVHSGSTVWAVSGAASVVELTKNTQAMLDDPIVQENRDHLRAIRKQGSRLLYQAVRSDGASNNSSAYWTQLTVTDEAGYLQALNQLRVVFDTVGLKDLKIDAHRIIAGRTNFTHLVVISAPSADRLAAFLDAMANEKAMTDWLASAAKYRTVVANGTAREITK